jgi:hypothetical protein
MFANSVRIGIYLDLSVVMYRQLREFIKEELHNVQSTYSNVPN